MFPKMPLKSIISISIPLLFLLNLFAFAQWPPSTQHLFSKQTPPSNYAGDPEAEMTVPEIIRHWGYPVETHRTWTPDGYSLVLHRIPHGRNEPDPEVIGNSAAERKPVVFLQHGLFCSSSVWLMNLPHQSAGFLFADAGFDVWLGNSRGNLYSRGHRPSKNFSKDYWDFSWDEMAQFDVATMIEFVLAKTGHQQLHYVGHSQGTLTMLAKLSQEPAFGKKLKRLFGIAPVASLAHAKGLFRYMADRMYSQLLLFSALFGHQEFLPNTFLSRWLTELICGLSTGNPLCENFLFLISGPDSLQLNKTRIGIYLAHNPAGTSLRNVIHYCQMVRHGRMQAYDFGGIEQNRRRYGPTAQSMPPIYALNRIEGPPMHLFYSDSDWLATRIDVEQFLIRQLPEGIIQKSHRLVGFNHNDFLWGLRAPQEVYGPIVDEIWRSERHQDAKAVSHHRILGPKSIGKDVDNNHQHREETTTEDAFLTAEQLQQNAYGKKRKRRRRRK